MGILDRITGRAKQAAGDLTGDAATREQGRKEEAKGDAQNRAAEKREEAAAESERADRLDRET